MKTLLKTVPFTIDPDAIALGLLPMFDQESTTVLRFGMIPAKYMEIVRQMLEEKFRSYGDGSTVVQHAGDSIELKHITIPPANGDDCCAVTSIEGRRHIPFSMKKLVSEAEHLICLALYRHGNLVV